MKLKALIVSAVLAVAALSFSQEAFAFTCTEWCSGNFCTTNCY